MQIIVVLTIAVALFIVTSLLRSVVQARRVRVIATDLIVSWSAGNPALVEPTMIAAAFSHAELIVSLEGVPSEKQLELAMLGEAEYRAKLVDAYASFTVPITATASAPKEESTP